MKQVTASVWTWLARGLAGALLAATAAQTARVALGVRRANAFSSRAQRYARQLEHPSHRLLIVGDSTGVGLGAVSIEDSLAGRLARDFPQASIENRAELGARIACVLGQLADVNAGYDAVLIAAGGNDILRRTPYGDLSEGSRTFRVDFGGNEFGRLGTFEAPGQPPTAQFIPYGPAGPA